MTDEVVCAKCKFMQDQMDKFKDARLVKPLGPDEVLVMKTPNPHEAEHAIRKLRRFDREAPLAFAVGGEGELFVCKRDQVVFMRYGRVVRKGGQQ